MTEPATNTAQIIHCWTTIGVWGRERPRCPVLDRVIHCRNCEKFIDAGKQALQRPASEAYAREWTALIARAREQRKEHQQSVIVFRVGSEWFAVATTYLRQIEAQRLIHSLPRQTKGLVKGLVNVSGQVRTCYSLGDLLGVETASVDAEPERRTVREGLMVLRKGKRSYVFPVTEIRELTSFAIDDIKPVPATVAAQSANFLLGIVHYEKLHIGYLDADLVIAGFDRGTQ
jgi:chemotaxis-related protein WspD